MSAPSNSDFIAGIDPTNQATISGAQLLQLVSSATPFGDKGLTIVTTDVAGNPTVPNATVTTKWQTYIWLRIGATTVSMYVWNPNGAVDATFLQWQPAFSAAIAAGSIVNSMIADNTIQSVKIVSLDYSKLTGAPTGLTPSGPAGGSLTGTYPNPSVAAGVITDANMVAKTLTPASIKDASLTLALSAPVSGSAKDMARVNAGATGMEAFTPPSIFTDANVTTTGNVGKVPTVATSGAGDTGTWSMQAPTALGRILQIVETIDSTPDSTANNCDDSTLPTTANTKLTAALTAAITPINAGSTLLVEVGIQLCSSGAPNIGVLALFQDAGVNAIAAAPLEIQNAARPSLGVVRYKVASGSTTARTFKGAFSSSSGTARYNSVDGTTKGFGGTLGMNSWIRVTEYL